MAYVRGLFGSSYLLIAVPFLASHVVLSVREFSATSIINLFHTLAAFDYKMTFTQDLSITRM